MKKKKQPKICFISSSGGHFSELNKLKSIADENNSFLVVEKTKNFSTDFCKKVYYIPETNRKEWFFIIRFLFLCIREFFIFIKERPDIVLTAGALASFPMAKFAKMFRKKVIYIESYARVNELSLTGKKMYGIADLFLVQWPQLADKYEKAEYHGSIFGGEVR